MLAVGLAMDATAVAAARGLAARKLRARHVALVAIFFGGFQALMPLLGWFLGDVVGPEVLAFEHWIAFLLLTGSGGKMLWEARGHKAEPGAAGAHQKSDQELFGLRALLLLAITTSIDAFAAGVSLPMLGAPLPLSIGTIGVVTALFSAAGLFAGRKFGSLLGPRLDAFGGIVLIGLGAKVLLSHLGVL